MSHASISRASVSRASISRPPAQKKFIREIDSFCPMLILFSSNWLIRSFFCYQTLNKKSSVRSRTLYPTVVLFWLLRRGSYVVKQKSPLYQKVGKGSISDAHSYLKGDSAPIIDHPHEKCDYYWYPQKRDWCGYDVNNRSDYNNKGFPVKMCPLLYGNIFLFVFRLSLFFFDLWEKWFSVVCFGFSDFWGGAWVVILGGVLWRKQKQTLKERINSLKLEKQNNFLLF